MVKKLTSENLELFIDTYKTKHKQGFTGSEIQDILMMRHGENLQIFPIAFFDKGGLIKLECGIGKRLKKQDKRQVIRDKDDHRKGL